MIMDTADIVAAIDRQIEALQQGQSPSGRSRDADKKAVLFPEGLGQDTCWTEEAVGCGSESCEASPTVGHQAGWRRQLRRCTRQSSKSPSATA